MSYVGKKWDGVGLPPALKAHGLLLLLTLAPCLVYIPYSLNVVLHAALTVYIGSWRSVQEVAQEECMTHKDAAKFPIVGSCVLFGLFLLFKFLPKWVVNTVLSGYITLMGAFAINHVALPFFSHIFPERLHSKVFKLPTIPRIPFLLDEPLPLEFTLPQLILSVPSIAVGVWYGMTKNWLANNFLGLAFSLLGIESVALGSPQIATVLLCGLFVYDIFWVFFTPVMVSVAKNFEAPIKLLFPRGPLRGAAAGKAPFAMLGLGDIVVPGLWVALLLRYDVEQNFKSSYFQTVFWGYVAGLGTTIAVMNYFKAAQPALLYIVPAVLISVGIHAALRGEFSKLWNWHEVDDSQEAKKKKQGDAAAAASADNKKGQ